MQLTARFHYKDHRLTGSAICVANFCKCLCIFATMLLFKRGDKQPLYLLGDAIESYLKVPDPYTENICTLTKREVTSSTNP